MRYAFKSCLSALVAVGAFLSAGEAMATSSVDGVVFIHGTGDNLGSQSCSGSGYGWNCTVSSAVGYWGQSEIDSVRTGADGTKRPYVVVGFHGGSRTPWTNSSPIKGTGPEASNGDDIVNQIVRFMNGPDGVAGTSDDVTNLVIVTHSGGSNQARYILQQYTKSAAYTRVKNATKRVITVAAPTMGTYLANQVFTSGSFINTVNSVITFFGGSGFYNDDGTAFIRTTTMSSYNADASKFGNFYNPVSGVNFYSTGGTSGTKCYGVTLWGACIGIKGPTLGGSSCDSGLTDVALLALHTLYLNASDSGTARNKCSDGFISCMSAQRLGNSFGFNEQQDHNQSRRTCHGLDGSIRNYVNGTWSGYEDTVFPASDVAPTQWDACGFSQYAGVYNASGSKIGYTAGCGQADLGDGWCDWDCVAVYGHDAVPTWDSTGTKVLSWGADDCAGSNSTANTYTTTTGCSVDADCPADPYGTPGTCSAGVCAYNYTDTSNSPWADAQVFTKDGANYYYASFNGKSANGSSTTYFTDPYYGTGAAVGYCPQSWIGDGTCDECVLALYGADGEDCLPGHIQACGGVVTKYAPWQYTNNPIYNEGDPSTNGQSWYFWATPSAVAGNGICENSECARNNKSPCSADADCLTGTCQGGYCSISSSQCDTSADCLSGSCVNGGCTTSGADCSATTAAGTTISLCR